MVAPSAFIFTLLIGNLLEATSLNVGALSLWSQWNVSEPPAPQRQRLDTKEEAATSSKPSDEPAAPSGPEHARQVKAGHSERLLALFQGRSGTEPAIYSYTLSSGLMDRTHEVSFGGIGVAMMAWVAVWVPMLIFAFFYQQWKPTIMECIGPDEKPNRQAFEQNKWAVSIIRCLDHPLFCLFSCCCGAVRWGDTMATAGFMGFMCGVLSFMGVMHISSLTGLWVIHVAFFAFFRQKLRKRFGIRNGDCATWIGDICAYVCCMPCAVVQEARQIEMATQLGLVPTDARKLPPSPFVHAQEGYGSGQSSVGPPTASAASQPSTASQPWATEPSGSLGKWESELDAALHGSEKALEEGSRQPRRARAVPGCAPCNG